MPSRSAETILLGSNPNTLEGNQLGEERTTYLTYQLSSHRLVPKQNNLFNRLFRFTEQEYFYTFIHNEKNTILVPVNL